MQRFIELITEDESLNVTLYRKKDPSNVMTFPLSDFFQKDEDGVVALGVGVYTGFSIVGGDSIAPLLIVVKSGSKRIYNIMTVRRLSDGVYRIVVVDEKYEEILLSPYTDMKLLEKKKGKTFILEIGS